MYDFFVGKRLSKKIIPGIFPNLYVNMELGDNTHCFVFLTARKFTKSQRGRWKKKRNFEQISGLYNKWKNLDIWFMSIAFKVYFESICNWIYKTNFKQNERNG